MVKVIDYGELLTRPKTYYKTKCNHCGGELTFEFNDIWFDDPLDGVGRVECPICRTKVFMDTSRLYIPRIVDIDQVSSDVYEKAYKDTSRKGIQQLMDEKKKEEVYNENANR